LLILSSHNIKSLYVSPYYLRHWKRIIWKMRNTAASFRQRAYLLDLGTYMFYASPAYVTEQVEQQGFALLETRGFRLSSNSWFNTYISPYVHYAFRKL